jgi:hypothetical protein
MIVEQHLNMLATVDWLDWLQLGGLLLVFIVLVFVAWWAGFADRGRGKRRCPRCWYDLAYSPGMTCAECGYTGRRERDFEKTRRRLVLFFAAIGGCAGIGAHLIQEVSTRGWQQYMPTRGLIWVMPLVGERDRVVFDELEQRAMKDRISDGEWFAALKRCAKGDPGRRPTSDAWVSKYGHFVRTWASRRLDDIDAEMRAEVEELLLEIPPKVTLTTRRLWPIEYPPVVNVEVRDWLRRNAQVRVTADPLLPGAETDVHYRQRVPIQPRSYSLHLPPLDPGEHDVRVKMTYEQRLDASRPWRSAGSEVLEVPIHIADGTDAMPEPVTNDKLDAAVSRAFSVGVHKWPAGEMPVRVDLRARPTFNGDFANTGIAVRVDVLRNGELARQLDIWWEGGLSIWDRQYSWEVPFYRNDLLLAPDAPNDVWELHVRGVPELALRMDSIEKYWAGEFTVPVRVIRRSGPAPSRGWIVEGKGQKVDKSRSRQGGQPG